MIPVGRARALLLALSIGAVAVLTSPLAFHAFFTSFQEYDDEGYLLISLREYARGGVLYDDVYSQYGPAYFQLLTPVFRLGRLAFDHTHGRALGLVLVVLTAVLCGLATWRLGRSLVIALAAHVLVLQALLPSHAEPLHPGALLALLLGGLVLVGTFLDGPRGRLAAASLGALLAAMLLVKVNVGAFAALGVAGALAAAAPPGRRAARLHGLVVAGMVAVPVVLLGPRLGEPAVRAYAAVVLAAALGVATVAFSRPPGGPPAVGRLRGLLLAGGLVLAGGLGWEMWRGTTPGGLLEGILLGPLRHPAEFFVEPVLGAAAFGTAAAGLGGALAFAWARRRGLTEAGPGAAAVGAAQILGGLLLGLGVAYRAPVEPLALTPFLWLALASRRAEGGRLVLAMVAAVQTLHAYPVAGTQVAWATFLAIPAAGVALAGGGRRVGAALRAAGALGVAPARRAGALLSVGLAAVTATGAVAAHRRLEAEYAAAVPLGLPGTAGIRVPAEQAALYRFLVGTVVTRCRTLVTQPGLYSLHLFTGMEPPTRLNATVWMLLLSDAQQERIVHRLSGASPPVCAVRRQRRTFRTPLARYIEERFVTLFELEAFEFRVRREPGPPAPA